MIITGIWLYILVTGIGFFIAMLFGLILAIIFRKLKDIKLKKHAKKFAEEKLTEKNKLNNELNKEQKDWIKNAMSRGLKRKQIVELLENNNWKRDDIVKMVIFYNEVKGGEKNGR